MRIAGFVHALRALESRLAEVVLTGGWPWYLYRKYLTGERKLPGEFTLDVDLVVPRPLSSSGVRLDELLAAADFKLEMEGQERPPVSRHCWPSIPEPEAVVEFLTPARGSGDAATLAVSGIVAQQLRFLDLLLDDPMPLVVDERGDTETFAGTVRVPRVGLFITQKALTFGRRHSKEKRYKDLFYIFDLAEERGLQATIGEDVRSYVGRGGSAPWVHDAAAKLHAACGVPEADSVGHVLRQIPEELRPPRRYIAETFVELARILRQGAGRS